MTALLSQWPVKDVCKERASSSSSSLLHSGAVVQEGAPIVAELYATEIQLLHPTTQAVVDVWPLTADSQVVRDEALVNGLVVGVEGYLTASSSEECSTWVAAIQAAVASLATAQVVAGSVIRSPVAEILADPSAALLPTLSSVSSPKNDDFGTVVRRGSSRIGGVLFTRAPSPLRQRTSSSTQEEASPVKIILYNTSNQRQNFVLLPAEKFALLTVGGLKRHAYVVVE